MNDATWWIEHLGLQSHPEGGYYRETYRSSAKVQTDRGERAASTAIYYLIGPGEVSALHRLHSDEVFHHYAGSGYAIYEIGPDGQARTTMLGSDVLSGQVPQHIVRAGNWFGSDVPQGPYALVGCTVSPGFAFEDFEMADRGELMAQWPQHSGLIERLTCESCQP